MTILTSFQGYKSEGIVHHTTHKFLTFGPVVQEFAIWSPHGKHLILQSTKLSLNFLWQHLQLALHSLLSC